MGGAAQGPARAEPRWARPEGSGRQFDFVFVLPVFLSSTRMDGKEGPPPASPHERSTPLRSTRTASGGSSQGGGQVRTRSYTRETAEPLAHALDATLSDLMDTKIAKFAQAFDLMQSKLDRQQKQLDRLEEKLAQEEETAREENAEIHVLVAEIHQLIDENVTVEQLDELSTRIGGMEHYVQEEIEAKMEQIKSMNAMLMNFTKIGEGAKRGIDDAKETAKKYTEEVEGELQRKQAEMKEALVRWFPLVPPPGLPVVVPRVRAVVAAFSKELMALFSRERR